MQHWTTFFSVDEAIFSVDVRVYATKANMQRGLRRTQARSNSVFKYYHWSLDAATLIEFSDLSVTPMPIEIDTQYGDTLPYNRIATHLFFCLPGPTPKHLATEVYHATSSLTKARKWDYLPDKPRQRLEGINAQMAQDLKKQVATLLAKGGHLSWTTLT